MFQSLIGFKINWNLENQELKAKIEKFQSLIGFKINWNESQIAELTAKIVSIPNRV